MSNFDDLSAREALSGILGSISLAAWVFVLAPQLLENYKAKNAQGISLAFLIVWFIGDLTNLIGAVWAALVPTLIAIAFYFCIADTVLILQCLYYNYYCTRTSLLSAAAQDDPSEDPRRPLLVSEASTLDQSGVHRRFSGASQRQQVLAEGDYGVCKTVDKTVSIQLWMNIAIIIGVCLLGIGAWAFAWAVGLWRPTHENLFRAAARGPFGAEILGYISAICYLSARLPQIVQNYREKSCEGLSLLFFMLSLLGNATYGSGIILHSMEKGYIVTNLPWLIGSLGTMGEDVLIFAQFHKYSKTSV